LVQSCKSGRFISIGLKSLQGKVEPPGALGQVGDAGMCFRINACATGASIVDFPGSYRAQRRIVGIAISATRKKLARFEKK
jgi:hypothetical protein